MIYYYSCLFEELIYNFFKNQSKSKIKKQHTFAVTFSIPLQYWDSECSYLQYLDGSKPPILHGDYDLLMAG